MVDNTLNRIKKFIDSKEISIRVFEQSVGMSNGSFASQLKHNKTIGVDKLENILHTYPEVSPEWLLTGKGDMLKPTAELPPTSSDATHIYNVYKDMLTLLREKDAEIIRLTWENGALQAEIKVLQREKKDEETDKMEGIQAIEIEKLKRYA
jgi:hypothetical protein